jgi:hypothetical protein
MARYVALQRLALSMGIVEMGQEFVSDDVPGRFWKPLDREARAAVKARDEAPPKPNFKAPTDREVALENELATLKGQLAEAEAEAEKLKTDLDELTAPAEGAEAK